MIIELPLLRHTKHKESLHFENVSLNNYDNYSNNLMRGKCRYSKRLKCELHAFPFTLVQIAILAGCELNTHLEMTLYLFKCQIDSRCWLQLFANKSSPMPMHRIDDFCFGVAFNFITFLLNQILTSPKKQPFNVYIVQCIACAQPSPDK